MLAARTGLILTALLFVSTVHAGTALPGAQVEDPAGDAGPGLSPVGAGFEAYDIVSIRLTERNATHLLVEIQVVDLPRAPPHGEIGVVFRVDERHYMAGFTVLVYDGAYYAAGFACPATPEGRVNGSVWEDCIGLSGATATGDVYRVDVPREFVGAAAAGTTLHEPFGWSEVVQFKSDPTYVDWTDVGRSLTLEFGAPAADDDPSAGPSPDGHDEGGQAPGVHVAAVAICIVLALLSTRYRGKANG